MLKVWFFTMVTGMLAMAYFGAMAALIVVLVIFVLVLANSLASDSILGG